MNQYRRALGIQISMVSMAVAGDGVGTHITSLNMDGFDVLDENTATVFWLVFLNK